MKLSKRAKEALANAGFSTNNETSALSQLVGFAAQNPGLEFGNYGEHKAYNAEMRSILADWQRFKKALAQAALDGVTSADVIAEAPHAFSGRLEWKTTRTIWEGQAPNCTKREEPTEPFWGYTTGQYWPTEYRKAAATLLEYTSRRVRQARPPQKASVTTIADLKALNAQNGGCWFDKSSMRFFGTKICSGIIDGKYFITSEQPPHGSRAYSVRSFDDEGSIDTFGEFCSYESKAEAIATIPKAQVAA